MVTLIPVVPWRYAKADVNFGGRFTSDRSVSLFSVTNNKRVGASWLGMSKKVCNAERRMRTGNPMKAMGGLLMNAGASAMGAGKYTGGAMLGCEGWQLCQDHAMVRCSAYKAFAYVGLLCLVFQLIGSVAAFVVLVMMAQEASAGAKKKKQDAAKQLTMIAACVGFSGCFLSTFIWIIMSHLQLQALQSSSYYPWAGAHAGMYMSLIGVFFLSIGAYCGVTRLYPNPLFVKGPEEAEEYAVPDDAQPLVGGLDDAGNADLPPGMAPPPPPQ